MMNWTGLAAQQLALGAKAGDQMTELRRRLARLADGEHCDRTVPHRFTHKTTDRLSEWLIRPKGSPSLDPKEWSEPLMGLHDGVAAARLTLLALVYRDELRDLTVMWEPEPWGSGAPSKTSR